MKYNKILSATLATCVFMSGSALTSFAKEMPKICLNGYKLNAQCAQILFECIGGNPEYKPETEQKPEIEQKPETEQRPEIEQKPELEQNSIEQQVLVLVNNERAKHGLKALTLDQKLNDVALTHSKDMSQRNFFSHTNPDGLSPFDRMKRGGVSYKTAAENIAMGYKTAEAVVNGWMNSEGHRKNILNGSFNKMGLGYFGTGNYWTQLFTD